MTSYRFSYLDHELLKLSNNVCESPVEKTCVLVYPDFNIVFDMTDGIHELFPFDETVGLQYRYINAFPGKKYFYVKVNYSSTRSTNHVKLAEMMGGRVISCPGFSLYRAYNDLVSCRSSLRKKRRDFVKDCSKTSFIGNLLDLEYPELYTGGEFEFPVTCVDAGILLKKSVAVKKFKIRPSRNEEIERFKRQTHIDVDMNVNVPFVSYIELMLKSSSTLQPNGISIRHAVYESMCMGIPSIVFKSSYIKEHDEKCMIIFDDDTTKEAIKEKLTDIDESMIIDHWESTMTPEKIISDVIRQVEELL